MDMVHSESRASLKALIGIYSRLLERISNSGYEVLRRARPRARLGKNLDSGALRDLSVHARKIT